MGAGGKRGKAGPRQLGCRALPSGIWAGRGGHPAVCRGCGEGTAGCLGGQRVPVPGSGTGRPRGRRQFGCRPHAAPVEPGQPRHSACGFPPLATTPGDPPPGRRGGGHRRGETLSIPERGTPYNNKLPGRCHQRALPGKEMLPNSHTRTPAQGIDAPGGHHLTGPPEMEKTHPPGPKPLPLAPGTGRGDAGEEPNGADTLNPRSTPSKMENQGNLGNPSTELDP